MTSDSAKTLYRDLIKSVQLIDGECNTRCDGHEHGLVNVKLEFQEIVKKIIGKTLSEETLISWLSSQRLRRNGWHVQCEVPYHSEDRKKCDLVVADETNAKLWMEVKLAWKAWFNCSMDPTYNNSLFRSYLEGTNRSHSFRQDLEKLGDADFAEKTDRIAVCLIGFDWFEKPMDEEVMRVVELVNSKGYQWSLAAESHWIDRRNDQFRINLWVWELTRK